MKRWIFTFVAVAGLASANEAYSQEPVCLESIQGLVGWWRGGLNSAVNNHNAVLTGQSTIGAGRIGDGYHIGGAFNDGLVISNSAPFAVSDFTIGAWIKRDELTRSSQSSIADGAIFAWGNLGYTLTVDSNGGLFIGHVGVASDGLRPRILDLNWHHVAVVKNGSSIRYYIDGEARGESSAGYQFTFTGPVGIGRLGTAFSSSSSTETYSFLGQIDEVTFFDRPLSAEEVSSVFASTTLPGCRAAITMRATRTTIDVGESADIEIQVANLRAQTISNLFVEIPRSSDFQIERFLSPAGSFSNSTERLVWNIATIPPSGVVSARITARPTGLSDIFTATASLFTIQDSTNVIPSGIAAENFEVTGPCVSRPPGLVGWWRLEDDGLDEITGIQGELVGSPSFNRAKVGVGLVANGGASAVVVGNRAGWRTQNPTVEAWIRRGETNRAAVGQIAGAFFSGGAGSYGVGMFNDGRLYFAIQANDAVDSGYKIQDTGWHHVVIGRDNGVVRFFVDGRLVQTASYFTVATFDNSFGIGGFGTPFNNDRYGFLGEIDEVSLYDRPLSEGEVATLYRAGHFGKCVGDLVLDTIAPETVPAGAEFNLTLAVRNLDRSAASDIAVSNAIPAGSRWLGADDSAAGSFAESGGYVVWNLTNVPAARTTAATLRFLAPDDSRVLTNIATMIARTGDGSPANNQLITPIQVEGPCGPSPSGLVAWFSGDDGAIERISSEAIDGAIPEYLPGKVGTAVWFNGQSSGFSLPRKISLEIQEFTVETWLRRQSATDITLGSPSENATIAGIADGGPNFLIGRDGRLGFGRTGSPAALVSSTLITDTTWHHVAVAKSSTNVTLYIDGQFAGTTAFQETLNYTAAWGVGAVSPSRGSPFFGSLDELAIYNRPLTAGEVAAIHGFGSSGRCSEDIVLGLTAPATAVTGEPLTQTIRVSNRGASPATSVRVTNLFGGLQFVGATNTAGVSIPAEGPGQLVWDIGTLAAGTSTELAVTLVAQTSGTNRVSASVIRSETDLTLANNIAGQDIVSQPLTISITGPAAPLSENADSAQFTVRISPPTSLRVSVAFATADGTARAGLDYVATNGVIEFLPGVVEQTLQVILIDNRVAEGTEDFQIILTNAVGGVIETGSATVTITDNEPVPVLTVAPARIVEGNSGRTEMRFNVRLSGRSDGDVTARFATLNDTARAGSDFIGTNGVVTVAPGQLESFFEIAVLGDRTVEPNELFLVAMSDPTNAVLTTTNIVGIIINDDAAAGQIAGFRWDGVPTNRLPAGATINAALTAIDGFGTPVSDFSAAVSIGAYAPGLKPSTLVVSELQWQGGNDAAEFQNTTTNALNISGWLISFFDGSRWPLPKTTFAVPQGTVVPPGSVFTLAEGAGAPNTFPTLRLGVSLSWRDNVPAGNPDPMAVLIQDITGDVVDFVGLDGAEASQIAIPVSLPRSEWTGPSISFARSTALAASRKGSFDGNSAVDWSISTQPSLPSLGRVNGGLTLPFADAASLPISPSLVVDFTNGVWAGEIALSSRAALFSLFADDGNGNTGVSVPIAMDIPNNLAVGLAADRSIVTNAGSVNYTLSVTNPGPDIATNVVATVQIDRAITSVSAITFPGERPTVAFNSGGYFVLSWAVGDLPPGTNRTLVFRQRMPTTISPSTGPLFLVNEARITSAAPDGDPLNDVAAAEVEVTSAMLDVTPHIVAWWTSDLVEDGATTNESAPAGATAILVGASRGPGRIGSGWDFNGAPGGVRVEASPAISWPSNSTTRIIEGWVRVSPASATGIVPIVGRRGPAEGWQINLVDGRPEMLLVRNGVAAGGIPASPLARSVADNRWHHVGFVESSAGIATLYVDGLTAASGAMESLVGLGETEPLIFGADREGRTLTGSLDEWSLLKFAVNPSALFTAGGSGKVLYRLVIPRTTLTFTASVGIPITVALSVTNTGVGTAPLAGFTASVENATDVSITSSPGTVGDEGLEPFAFAGEFGNLVPGGIGSVSFTFTATNLSPRPVLVFDPSSPSVRGIVSGIRAQAFVTPDTDGDGMNDDWEILYGLDRLDPADATLDRDGDGIDNRSEFIAGTDPTSASSAFRLAVSRVEAGGYRITFQVAPDRDWILEEAVGLGQDATWNYRASGSTGAEAAPVEVISTEESGRLFRARISRR